MIITPFETEAKNLFGVMFMEKLLEAQEQQGLLDFIATRDAAWATGIPQPMRQAFLDLARWCEKYKNEAPAVAPAV